MASFALSIVLSSGLAPLAGAGCPRQAADHPCCCEPAARNVLCAPDCCDRVAAAARANVAPTTTTATLPLFAIADHVVARLRYAPTHELEARALPVVPLPRAAAPPTPLRI